MPRRGKFSPSCKRSRAKKLSTSRGFAPDPLTSPLGAPAPYLRYKVALCTRHGLKRPLNFKC